MALIGALDALVTLDGVLYVLLYVFELAFAFYPLMNWCRTNEGFSWPWPSCGERKGPDQAPAQGAGGTAGQQPSGLIPAERRASMYPSRSEAGSPL